MSFCPVGTSCKRRTLHMSESQIFRENSILFKLFQWDKSFHRQVFFTWL